MPMNGQSVKPLVADRMSERLITIATMLGDGSCDSQDVSKEKKSGFRVADVGCDHGYISIYLVQSGIASAAIAMDVRKGPLSGARDNISEYGLENAISTRLSDGLKELSEGEADSLVIAGMGGKLMMRILEEGNPRTLGIERAILQPQSELSEFRSYIREKGYSILDEKIVFEDGKYYFPMRICFSQKSTDYLSGAINELMRVNECNRDIALNICNRFGEINILRKDKLLKKYCEHGLEVCRSILKNLSEDEHRERILQVKNDSYELETVLRYFA